MVGVSFFKAKISIFRFPLSLGSAKSHLRNLSDRFTQHTRKGCRPPSGSPVYQSCVHLGIYPTCESTIRCNACRASCAVWYVPMREIGPL